MEEVSNKQKVEYLPPKVSEQTETFHSSPEVSEKKLWQFRYILFAVLIGFAEILISVLLIYYFNAEILISIIISFIATVLYAVILYFLLEPRLMKEIKLVEIQKHTRTIHQPIRFTKQVPVIKEIEKPIYIKRTSAPRKKYIYVGSSKTKKYHLTSSRLAKLIANKNKVFSNSEAFFTKRGYRPSQQIKKIQNNNLTEKQAKKYKT